jgi:AhpD family alkylhydroperoxidase
MEATQTIEPRIPNIAGTVPEALQALLALAKAAAKGGNPPTTHKLVHLRASQINGCSFCVDMHSRELRDARERDERIWGVASWRESPYFNDAERAALTLAEAGTRLSDREDPVPDEVWAHPAAGRLLELVRVRSLGGEVQHDFVRPPQSPVCTILGKRAHGGRSVGDRPPRARDCA